MAYKVRWEGLEQADADVIQDIYLEADTENVDACSCSFITYDGTSPSYNPNDPSTWTEDLWVGRFVIEATGVGAMDYIQGIADAASGVTDAVFLGISDDDL